MFLQVQSYPGKNEENLTGVTRLKSQACSEFVLIVLQLEIKALSATYLVTGIGGRKLKVSPSLCYPRRVGVAGARVGFAGPFTPPGKAQLVQDNSLHSSPGSKQQQSSY